MTVRFKFRSSVVFDTVDLGGRPFITVGDLRAKIIKQKNLQICRDFDLVISDLESGQTFDDDNIQIPDGSSVIIKRVPAGRSGVHNLGRIGAIREPSDNHVGGFITAPPLVSSPSENVDTENYHDFGIELYPALQGSIQESDSDFDYVRSTAKKDNEHPRCQNFGRSDLSEATPGGTKEKGKKECDDEGNKKQIKLNIGVKEHKLDGDIAMYSPTMSNPDLPAELKCSLCSMIFKDAVMIPCCQHSFCDKCIRFALVQRAMCPKCSSIKCTIKDLLPNLSLRQAIEHFLEAQVAINGKDNFAPKYVPDVESGIHGKDIFCAMPFRQEETVPPHSPSVTGMGSNHIMAGFAHESERTAGGNSSKLLLDLRPKGEANLAFQRRNMPALNPPDGGLLMQPSKHRKYQGDRTCYRCGSPNHLVRDCPAASNPYPVLQIGDAAYSGGMSAYGHPYWQGPTIPPLGPYANMYGTPGVIPFDPTAVSVPSFGIPSYMPPLYAGMQTPYGMMNMGNVQPPPLAGNERPLTRAEFMGIQDAERRNNFPDEHHDRKFDYDNISEGNHYNGTGRSHERKYCIDKETARSSSEEPSDRRRNKYQRDRHNSPNHRRSEFVPDEKVNSVERKHWKKYHLSIAGREKRTHYTEKLNAEVKIRPDSAERYGRDGKVHHKSCSKKQNIKGHSDSDGSRRSYHHDREDKSRDADKLLRDHKRQSRKHHTRPTGGFEPDYSSDRRHHHKEKESNGRSRPIVKSTDIQLPDDRWEMVDGLDEGYKKEYYHHKRRRT